ncbi:hypothetical protein [Nonomuraea salmonea]|uniref:hypothetical protein n=1 Tax=Nonomuraea salmonea TaxID=46181 RepID=UPI002FE7461A
MGTRTLWRPYGGAGGARWARGAESLRDIIRRRDDREAPQERPAEGDDGRLSEARAHWIDRDTVVWPGEPACQEGAFLVFHPGDVPWGHGEQDCGACLIRLMAGRLTGQQRVRVAAPGRASGVQGGSAGRRPRP